MAGNYTFEDDSQLLLGLVELSRTYGGPEYVRAGGGNASVKTSQVLYIKPSGLPMAALTIDKIVALDRAALAEVYALSADGPAANAQAKVVEAIKRAVISSDKARPSVETPLHDSLQWRFVVHTHPALVNGMTCSQDGRHRCAQLFPETLWIDYVDPGISLCIELRRAVQVYQARFGVQPPVIFVQNHGLVIGADSPQLVRQLHDHVMQVLASFYKRAGVPLALPRRQVSEEQRKQATAIIQKAFGREVVVEVDGGFSCATGPLTPDHVVYARSYPLEGLPTEKAVWDYRSRFGYEPRVLTWDGLVCGVGKDLLEARTALELAQDGALVVQLAAAFGGVRYMSEQARLFIEGWEAEAYRLKVLQSRS
jgi:rhamnose utilization protein RhaD (predicted bifunctional aldolase and dehydrogenase)